MDGWPTFVEATSVGLIGLVGGALAYSGLSKLAAPGGLPATLRRQGLPDRLARISVRLPAAEVALALLATYERL